MRGVSGFLAIWWGDEKGTLTIEFLLWLPYLALWFIASTIFYDAYKSRNEAANAAYTLSDIITRQTEVDNQFLDSLYTLQDRLLPQADGVRTLRISSIQFSGGKYQVLWSRSMGGGSVMKDADIPIQIMPAMAELDTVILTELAVPFIPFANWVGVRARTWSFDLVSRPRFASQVAKTDAPTS